MIQHEHNTNQYKQDHEKKLLSSFCKRNIVYIIIVKEDDDDIIIKFGYTDDITDRIKKHRRTYPGCYLVDVFAVLRNRQFEQYILNRTME
jgi:hypothetical protein